MTNWRLMATILLAISITLTIGSSRVIAEEQVIVSRGESFSISIQLLEYGIYGNPIPNQEVEFYDQTYDQLLGISLTNEEGIASLETMFDYTHPLGMTTLNATYRGNESILLAPICQYQELHVVSSTSMTLSTYSTEVAPGDILEFTVTLNDDIANPIPDAEILVKSGSIDLSTKLTNTSGICSFSIACNSTWAQLGTSPIEVIYAGDFGQNLRGISKVIELKMEKIETSLDICNLPNSTISLNQTLSYQVEGVIGNSSMAYKSIELYLDDIHIQTLITDASGVTNVSLSINNEIALGSHLLQAVYFGSERLNESHIDFEFSVYSPSFVDIDILEIPVVLSDLRMKISVSDYFGRAVPLVHVTVYDLNSQTTLIESSQLDTSIFIFHENLNQLSGPRNILINVTGNEFLTNCSILSEIIVWNDSKLTLVKSNIISYASPLQIIYFDFRLASSLGPIANQLVQANISEDILLTQNITDSEGITRITLTAPSETGQFTMMLYYLGNASIFQIEAQFEFNIVVSETITADIIYNGYSKIHSLNEIQVDFLVVAGNGTRISGIIFQYRWLDSMNQVISGPDGSIIFSIPLPVTTGIYNLLYEIKLEKDYPLNTGSVFIIIDALDANTGEGLGLIPLTIASLTSVIFPMYTILKKRFVLG